MTRPVGRPTKYTPDMCERVLAIGREGGCVAEMASACEVAVSTLYVWAGEHEDFSENFTRAQTEAEAFHSIRVRKGLNLPPSEFQGAANMKYMGQRFKERYAERKEQTGPAGKPIQTEALSSHQLAVKVAQLLQSKGDAERD